MMDAYCASLLVQAMAAQARVAGMIAENARRAACGDSISYGEEAFNIEATNLDYLAAALRSRAS